jgi:hypothetical protein
MIWYWYDKKEEEEQTRQRETVKQNEPANEDDNKTAEDKELLARDKADMHQTQEGNKSNKKEGEREQIRLKT